MNLCLAPPPAGKKPIWVVLFHLSNHPFGYIDVMQEFIDAMKEGGSNTGKIMMFRQFVDHICELAKIYLAKLSLREGDYLRSQPGNWQFNKETVLLALNANADYVSIQMGNADRRGNEFKNPLYYDVMDSKSIRPCLVNLLNKIRNKLTASGDNGVDRLQMNTICRYLSEQVVPILTVLTAMSEKTKGEEFIKQLDLRRLINELREIQKMEKEMETDDRMQADRRNQREDFMRTSAFNVNSIMPQVNRLVADKQYIASGNRAQSVIDGVPIPAKGGRRTKRHKKRSGGKKRSYKKRMSRRR
jgi:hypothetical protein